MRNSAIVVLLWLTACGGRAEGSTSDSDGGASLQDGGESSSRDGSPNDATVGTDSVGTGDAVATGDSGREQDSGMVAIPDAPKPEPDGGIGDCGVYTGDGGCVLCGNGSEWACPPNALNSGGYFPVCPAGAPDGPPGLGFQPTSCDFNELQKDLLCLNCTDGGAGYLFTCQPQNMWTYEGTYSCPP